ncbi:hypothetical protein FB45DRAFT_709304, partial [Roridomyces roridus]
MSANSNSLTVLPDGEKFDGTGFTGFETKFIAIADARGLRGYIEGTIPKPNPPAAATAPAAPTTPTTPTATAPSTSPGLSISQVSPASVSLPPEPTSIYSTSPNSDEWKHRDAMAKAMIVLNVKDPIGLGLKTDGSAAEAWSSL